jgi:hypothetical protein
MKIVELKGVVDHVDANQGRCKRLGGRLMMLKPALEAFQADEQGRSESEEEAVRIICGLVEEIYAFIVQYKKYEGRGPTIKGRGVGDFLRKSVNRQDDKRAFDEFNSRLGYFAQDLQILKIKTTAWSDEDAADEQSDRAGRSAAGLIKQQPADAGTGTLEQSYRFEPDESSSYIGEGAVGEVRMVRHVLDGEVRAVKMIKTRRAASVGLDENALKQEARSMLRLCHPNILRYHTSCWHSTPADGRIFCMVMEYANGGTLRDWINATRAAGGGVDTQQVFKFGLQIGSGLHHM